LAYDATEGLVFLGNFAPAREAFEDPGLAGNPEYRQAVLGYLKADSISALPFRRVAGADTGRAGQFFQHLLKKPGFSWERDGEALLRKHTPWCCETNPLPSVTPLSSELAEGPPIIQARSAWDHVHEIVVPVAEAAAQRADDLLPVVVRPGDVHRLAVAAEGQLALLVPCP
jgi:hypothetical protein